MAFRRLDIGALKEATVTAQGFIKADAFATRAGIFKYVMSDGTIRAELRPPDQVFDDISLKTLSQVPVTNEHPKEFVSIDNAKKLTVGFTGENVEQHGQFVKTNVVITDKNTINDMHDGKTELSCGYHCDIELSNGIYEGEHYDAVQTNIRYNHLAIVDKGRAGPEVRLRLDSQSAMMVDNEGSERVIDNTEKEPQNKKGKNMAKIKIDSIEYQVEDSALAQVITAKCNEVENLKKDLDTLQGKFDAKEVESKEQLEKKDKELEDIKSNQPKKEDMLKEAKERIDLEAFAKSVLGEETEISEKTDSEVKVEIIKKKKEDFNPEEKSDDYINGCFETLKEDFKKEDNEKEDKGADLKKELGDSTNKKEVVDSEKAREKAMDESLAEWQQPLAK